MSQISKIQDSHQLNWLHKIFQLSPIFPEMRSHSPTTFPSVWIFLCLLPAIFTYLLAFSLPLLSIWHKNVNTPNFSPLLSQEIISAQVQGVGVQRDRCAQGQVHKEAGANGTHLGLRGQCGAGSLLRLTDLLSLPCWLSSCWFYQSWPVMNRMSFSLYIYSSPCQQSFRIQSGWIK
jgi:hypothetical protein